MRRLATAIFAAAFLFAGVASAAPVLAAHAPAPIVFNASTRIRPASICFGPNSGPYKCGDSVKSLTWSSWGRSQETTTGTETWFSSPCTAKTCGSGPAAVRLSDISRYQGVRYYGQVTATVGVARKTVFRWDPRASIWYTVSTCYPVADDGNCYEPGEFCRTDDLRVTGLAGDGATIKCERYGRGDYPHWKRVSSSGGSRPKTLLSFTGTGIRNSAPFLVPADVSDLTVDYSYNCSAFGGSGNFIADLLYGNQSKPGSDDQFIANELGTEGSSSTTIYPQKPGKKYYLAVNSECDWSVTILQPTL